MLEAIAAMIVVLGIGFLMAHALDAFLEQGCAGFSSGSTNRCDQFTRHPGRTSSPLRPRLGFRYTHRSV
jgi:hypothetical protein